MSADLHVTGRVLSDGELVGETSVIALLHVLAEFGKVAGAVATFGRFFVKWYDDVGNGYQFHAEQNNACLVQHKPLTRQQIGIA